MTVTLHLPPQVEQAYLDQAKARGLQLAEVMRDALVAAQPSSSDNVLNTVEWLRQFDAWIETQAGNKIVLSAEAMERESIYGDHGL